MFTFLKDLFKPQADVTELLQSGAVIVDVRTKDEFDAGHIDGAKNIPLDRIKNELEKIKKLNKPIITVCRSGNRSEMAKSILLSAGVQAFNGGAWTELKRKLG
jgi:rhodanese-related sulfurtransferase